MQRMHILLQMGKRSTEFKTKEEITMTIRQLQYILEIKRTGSVSKAAKNLYMSQPNISSAVKSLESELGVTIFERTPMGMELTAEGRRLVEKASSIMADIEAIVNVQQTEPSAVFRLIYPRYVPAYEAFVALCRNHEERNNLQFSCFINGDELQQIEALYWNRCDLVVTVGSGSPQFRRLCTDLHVKFVPLMESQYYIQLSEQHPLIQRKTSFDVTELRDYPYVAFVEPNDWTGQWTPWEALVNPNRLICVQSTSSRVKMVADTHAYSIVLSHTEEYNKTHRVVQVPFDNKPVVLGYLYSEERGLNKYANEYIQLFKYHLSIL